MDKTDLMKDYGCIDCEATDAAVAKYNKVQDRVDAAFADAFEKLEANRLAARHLENDKIGLKASR